MTPSFIHLRNHSSFSLSEGAIKLAKLPELAKKHSMPAIGLTDTNNLFASLAFSQECSKAGIQPLIGTTAQLVHTRESNSEKGSLILFAQNSQGYANLMKLSSRAFVEALPDQGPVITLDEIGEFGQGIIALTGGSSGLLAKYIRDKRDAEAEKLLNILHETFNNRLYIELERHGLAEEEEVESALISFADSYNLPLVATNNVMFPARDMFEAQDALMCIATGRYVSEENRPRYTPEHYFKSPTEMQELFADIPEAITNTVVIAQRCHVMSQPHDPMLPRYDTEGGRSEQEEFCYVSQQGLEERLNNVVFPRELIALQTIAKSNKEPIPSELTASQREAIITPYQERLKYELDIISQMDFPGYFLIVSDFIRWAKEQGIPVGPGRGSGAGSLVAWSMQITDLDPLHFGLLFERFLNPERVSMPDFDIDFCQERREEVIHYVQQKYGYDRVAQIITYGKLQARAVVRDVGRVLQMSYGQTDRICKMIPNNPASPVTLQEAIDLDPELRREAKSDDQVARLLEIGLLLEGMHRHAGTHAAGVVIGSRPLDEIVPLYRDPRSTMPATQYAMKYAEMAGLVKFDFLGLKTLTQIKYACDLVRAAGHDIDIDHIPYDDKATFAMLAAGDSTGVFQMESAGMRDALRKMKPDTLEDIIALISLYRPGPMENIPTYIARKHGLEEPDYLHPSLEPCLKETFGVIIYQEQVMEIAKVLGGYTLGGADILRRAMGKKIKSEMDIQRELFMEGAKKNGADPDKAGSIFDLVAKFAGYGFNKSHAAAYAWIGYQTAYLKANYPVEFLTACMNIDIGDTDKVKLFCDEAKRSKIVVVPPDINRSQALFSVQPLPESDIKEGFHKRAIIYGLGGLKGVGVEAMQAMISLREKAGNVFDDMFHFARSCDSQVMNKRQIESLAKAGAFDLLTPNRRQIVEGSDKLSRYSQAIAEERSTNQVSLFGEEEAQAPPTGLLPECPPWDSAQKLAHERNAVGFYLTAHPLDAWSSDLQSLGITRIANIDESVPMGTGSCRLAAVVTDITIRASARGRFAYVALSDPSGNTEVSLFNEKLLTEHKDLLESDTPVLITAETRKDEGGVRILINDIISLDNHLASCRRSATISLHHVSELQHLKTLITDAPNSTIKNTTLTLIIPASAEMSVHIRLPGMHHLPGDITAKIQALESVNEISVQ